MWVRDSMINDFFNEFKMSARFFIGSKRFFKEKIPFDVILRGIKSRMQQREENLLKIIKQGIFGYKDSPYLPLFKSAGYEYRDIERLVLRLGVEDALKVLKDEGIYITIQEFKGKMPVVRKEKKFLFRENDFNNPYMPVCYEGRSSASRGPGMKVEFNFEFLSQTVLNRGLIADLWGLSKMPHIIIRPVFPYGPGIMYMLQLGKLKIYPLKWISPINDKNIPISLKSRLGINYIIYTGKLFGERFPKYEFINSDDILKVIGIITQVLKEYKNCCIFTNVSQALRICLAAKHSGIRLDGTKFEGCGEPLTLIKKREIESTGAQYILHYAFTEAGLAGNLCLNSELIDGIHLFKDILALISYKRKVTDSYVDAFLFTSLLPSAPKILLNVESGDFGTIETKNCGCPYSDLGYDTHIHSIRSFEKLTGEGMTFYGSDLIRIFEEIIPFQFGGSSLDYQLVEEEDLKGITSLLVLASPKLGDIDEAKLITIILSELGKGTDSRRVMSRIWEERGTIKVKREYPILTESGKMYPLYIRR